ncbi:MAG: DNRLRE domain-containing protein [Candidatus Zixiibacteriota bacterium]
MKKSILILLIAILSTLIFCDDDKTVNNPTIQQYAELHGYVISNKSITLTRIPDVIVTIAGKTDTTNNVGRFFMDSVPYGENSYTCIHPDYYFKNDSVSINKSLQIVEFFLDRDPNIISGQVKTGKGEIVSDAIISFDNIADTTDSDGNYSLSVYDFGLLLIACKHPDHTDYYRSINVSEDTTIYNIIWRGNYVDTFWIEEDVTIMNRIHMDKINNYEYHIDYYLEDSNFAYLNENKLKCFYDVYYCYFYGEVANYYYSRQSILMKLPMPSMSEFSVIDSAFLFTKRTSVAISGINCNFKYVLSTWSDTLVTWETQPDLSDLISGFALSGAEEFTKIDITNYYDNYDNNMFGLYIYADEGCYLNCDYSDGWGWTSFYSSEAENPNDRPFVEIFYTID